MTTTDTEPVEFEMPGIANYYGGLYVQHSDGVFKWAVEDETGAWDWQEIPESLYLELKRFRDEQQTPKRGRDLEVILSAIDAPPVIERCGDSLLFDSDDEAELHVFRLACNGDAEAIDAIRQVYPAFDKK